MKIKLNKKQRNILENAIQASNNLYKGNFKDAIDWIFETNSDSDLCLEIRDLISTEYINEDLINCNIENYPEDKSSISILCSCLDLVVRMALGQWEVLNNVIPNNTRFFMDDFNVYELYRLRNKTVSIFEENNIRGLSMSFGIYSQKIKNKIKVVYDIYKVLMFENGCGGVYGYQPSAVSDEPLPIITFIEKDFPNVKEGDLIKAKNLCLDHKFYEDGEGLYLPVEEYRQHLAKVGDSLKLKRNGYWIVEPN